MKKIIFFLSKIILILACLNIFAWSIFHVNDGGKRFGVLTNSLKEFSRFPTLVASVVKEMNEPERLLNYDPLFKSINKLEYDVFALNASFHSTKWVIKLVNLRNNSIIYKWYLDEPKYLNTGRIFSHSDPRMPIILGDSSLIIHNDESKNLFRLNSNSEIMWHNTEHQFHHSINLDNSGNIWTCTRDLIKLNSNGLEYWDNYLTKVDVNDGRVLYHKSLTEILLDNNLSFLIHGYSNQVAEFQVGDPLHLNEIQPVLKSGKYWNEGDLFLSLRHRSMIILYRPSTNKIIRIIQGPFFNQHDVDIFSDSTISLFNNNVSSLGKINSSEQKSTSKNNLLPNLTLNSSAEVLVYNLNDSIFTSLYPKQFIKNKIYTRTQGVHHILSNGDLFVENWSEGIVYIFNDNETLLKKYFNQPENGYLENTHWIRIYENLNFLKY